MELGGADWRWVHGLVIPVKFREVVRKVDFQGFKKSFREVQTCDGDVRIT